MPVRTLLPTLFRDLAAVRVDQPRLECFFVVMAPGAPQVVFGDPRLVGTLDLT